MKMIPVVEPVVHGNELKYLKDCLKSTWLSSGKYVDLFEEKFAKFCEANYAASVVNGTAALHVLLATLGIKKGDEVIIPNLTFVATANAVIYTGAKPVFVDVDRQTWNIAPQKIEEKITKKTKAIIAVHLYGHPADMDQINSLAKSYNILVLEDACEAHGALYKGRKVGSLSLASCFSFYGNKIITTGEGGMIVSNNKSIIKRANFLKSHSQIAKGIYHHTEIGFNYRFTNLQAALGLAQLENVNNVIKRKLENANAYNDLLKDVEDIILPPDEPWARSVFWMYSIVLRRKNLRDKLILKLADASIETRPFFEPLHKLPMYKENEDFPNSTFLSKNGLSLPSSALLAVKEIEYICATLKKLLKRSL